MKKELMSLIFLIVIAIFINRNAIFAQENTVDLTSQEVQDTKIILEDILEKRAILFNSLANDESEFLEIKSELRSLEIEPLYSFDIEAFALLLDKPTQIDIIKQVDVMEVLDYTKDQDEVMIEAKIKWLMEDIAGHYVESRQYRFHLKLDYNIYKLKDYEIIEETLN